MKIEPRDVILWSVFDDEPNLVVNKASFGGDRSAAGRYAAEQRWKGHQKKGDKPTGGRTTDQKLAEGPTNLLFGRDANGMPVMGSVKELKTRYGKSAESREEYFRTRYGVKLKIKPAKAGSVAEAVQMGVLQALEEICLSTNLDNEILRGVSVGDTGGDANYEKEANGWYSNGYVTVKPETIEKRLGDLLSKLYGTQTSRGVGLKPSTKEDEDWYGDEAMSNIPLYSTSQMLPSIPAVAQDLKPYFSTDPTKQPPSRRDLYSQMAQRAGYAVMVHEFGHAVDFGASTQGESVSTQAGEEWDKLRAPTRYGQSNPYEKAAESFAAWWLFGGGQGNLPKGIAGIGRLADPILRPILEARGDLVKNAAPPIDIAALPLDHPVIQFILAPLLNPVLQKARVKVDAMVAAAFVKASFGGDRSAAGRYAAEQRWKGHQKKGDKPTGGRTTDEQLAKGPQNLAFGRDKNGLPTVGSRQELETKYGKTDKERAAYFQKKYGIKVDFTDLEGQDETKNPDAIEVKLGAVQALDDILSNLNVIPVGLTSKPPIAQIRIGTDNPTKGGLSQPAIAFVRHDSKDSRRFLLALDTAMIEAMTSDLLYRSLPITEQQALIGEDESPLDVINLRRLEETGGKTIAGRFGTSDASRDKGGTWEKITREDEATIARRLGYAIMVHEWGHVLDTKSFFDAKPSTIVREMTSDLLEEASSPKWRKTQAVSEYGEYNVWEKMAEGFSAWFLFSQSANPVRYYSPKTNVGFSEASRWLKNQDVIDIKQVISPTMRPLFDSLRPPLTGEQVLKRVGDFVTTVADLPFDHPVIMFALQPFMDDGMQKARVRRDAMIAAALAKASFGGDRSAAGRYAAEQRWKGHVKQSAESHDGSSSKKLSLDELKEILGSSANAVKAHEAIAKRLGKTMKPKVEDLSDDDINAWRAVSDNGAKRLVQGKIKNAEWATYGQGLYVMMAGQKGEGMTEEYAKDHAFRYGKNLIGLRLGESAKIVDGAERSSSVEAAEVRREIEKQEFHSTVHYSHEDFHNLYWASQGFDGWQPSGRQKGGEVLLFNAEHVSVNRADLPPEIANRKMKKSFIRRDAMIDAAFKEDSDGE